MTLALFVKHFKSNCLRNTLNDYSQKHLRDIAGMTNTEKQRIRCHQQNQHAFKYYSCAWGEQSQRSVSGEGQ